MTFELLKSSLLRDKFGSWGEHLWKLANGIDARRVVPDRTAKQISHERTFSDDIADEAMLRAVVSYLCEQVARRLRRHRREAKTVGIKYRREDFRTFARSRTFAQPTDSTDEIFRSAAELLCGNAASPTSPGTIDRSLCRLPNRKRDAETTVAVRTARGRVLAARRRQSRRFTERPDRRRRGLPRHQPSAGSNARSSRNSNGCKSCSRLHTASRQAAARDCESSFSRSFAANRSSRSADAAIS